MTRAIALVFGTAVLVTTASAGIVITKEESGVQPAKPPSLAKGAEAPKKDVVLDNPSAAPPPKATLNAQRAAVLAASMGDLGLAILSPVEGPSKEGSAANSVVSPLSLASAMGLLQIGAKGATARDLSYVLDSGASRGNHLGKDLPILLGDLQTLQDPAAKTRITMANRVWIDQRITETVSPDFVTKARQRWGADGAVVPFAAGDATRGVINEWVASQTGQKIKEVLPSGSINGNTRFVVTNAIHFKGAWEQPFDPSLTAPKPFKLQGKASVDVPTMQDERSVGWAKLPSGETVLELPFAGKQVSLLVVMPKEGVALADAIHGLRGADLLEYQRSLKAQSCQLRLPKFKLSPAPSSLKGTLNAMGVQAPFSDGADFSGILGKKADAKLDDVFHAATFEIDEAGGEASAATTAVVAAKSIALPAPECVIDRPFAFALLHKASGTPLFIGQVSNPGER